MISHTRFKKNWNCYTYPDHYLKTFLNNRSTSFGGNLWKNTSTTTTTITTTTYKNNSHNNINIRLPSFDAVSRMLARFCSERRRIFFPPVFEEIWYGLIAWQVFFVFVFVFFVCFTYPEINKNVQITIKNMKTRFLQLTRDIHF